jgi:predicted porin
MQKTLLSLALLGCVGVSQAQSNTTLYGVVDAMYTYGTGELARKTALGSGGNMTSRWGIRGSEVIGGGFSAEYNLEMQHFTDTGEGQGTNTNNQTTGATTGIISFARRATVSLKGEVGELRLGRDFTAHYRNRVEVDPFGNAGVGASQAFSGSIGGVISTRASNMVGYFLPTMGGVYGQIQYYLGENVSGNVQSNNGTGLTARIGYENGPINVSLASGKTQYATTASVGNITSSNIGVRYTLGEFALMGGLYRDEIRSTAPLHAKGWLLAGTWQQGASQVKLALSQYGTDAINNPSTRKLAVGTVYNLSKRTALYATVAKVANSGGAAVALNGALTKANASSSGADIGVRHTF